MENIIEHKDKMTTLYIMDYKEFESLLKDPNHRNISDSSYKTYKRNLDLLIKEVHFDKKNSLPFPTIQEMCYFMAEVLLTRRNEEKELMFNNEYAGHPLCLLSKWSNSTKRARIAALLIGIDPSGKEEDLAGTAGKHILGKEDNITTKQDFALYKGMKLNDKHNRYTEWNDKYFHNSADEVPVSARTGTAYLKKHTYTFPKKAMIITLLRKIIDETQKKYTKTVSEMNVKESANWVNQKDLMKRAAKMRKIWKETDTKGEYPYKKRPVLSALLDALIATIYTRFPPRRLDWSRLIFNKDGLEVDEETKSNMIIYDGEKITFGKNAGKSNQQDDYIITKKEIGPTLRKLLKEQTDTMTGGDQYVFRSLPLSGGTRMSHNSLGKRITKIFTFINKKKNTKLGINAEKIINPNEEKNRKVSVGMLRKIFISENFAGDRIKKSKIALAMNHSVRIQQAIYNKKGMEMTSNDVIQFEVNQHHLDPFF